MKPGISLRDLILLKSAKSRKNTVAIRKNSEFLTTYNKKVHIKL